MAKKKEDYIVKMTEESNLTFYAVKSLDGKWFRAKGYEGSGNSWVDDITKARIYAKPGPAMSQVTFWAKNYPQFGIPDLVRIKMGVLEYLDQTEEVKDKIFKQNKKKIQEEIDRAQYRINNHIERTKIDKSYVEREKADIEKLKKKLADLKR